MQSFHADSFLTLASYIRTPEPNIFSPSDLVTFID